MSKKVKTVRNEVRNEVRVATVRIKELCAAENITATNKYAVLKDLIKAGSVNTERAWTSWGKDAEGNRGLVVMNATATDIKFYTTPDEKFSSIKNANVPEA